MYLTSSQSREASAMLTLSQMKRLGSRDLVTSPRFRPRQWQAGQEWEVADENIPGGVNSISHGTGD